MAYVMKENIASTGNYGAYRNKKDIQYIVIHYTANDGDTDENNGKYFHNNVVMASAHYFVDSDSITKSVDDSFVAWSVGGAKWNDCSKTGGGKLYGKVTNQNSLNIELCDDNPNGVIYPSEATIQNAIEFVSSKMVQYGIPAARVIRHFDVNGKHCPAYWMDDAKWESEFHSKLPGMMNSKKSNEEIAKEVIQGKWGNGEDRKQKLALAGYIYSDIQAIVNKLASPQPAPKPVLKSVDEIAKEVLAGKWGNGSERKQKLEAAGYNYAAVQDKVNKLCTPSKKSIDEIAKEVIQGKWGNGSERKQKLEAAGYNYLEVQNKVNQLL